MQRGIKTRIIRDHPFDEAHHVHNFIDRIFNYEHVISYGGSNQVLIKTRNGFCVHLAANPGDALNYINSVKNSIAQTLYEYLNEVDPDPTKMH